MVHVISPIAARRRASALAALRRGLDSRGFLEVTTPVLLKVEASSPAPMHPFGIGGNTYDLRNSIELLLRTALAASSRVYDIGPAIRFEDTDKGARSAVEFTLLECFATDIDYDGLISLVQELLRETFPQLPSKVDHISVVDWFVRTWGISFEEGDRTATREKLAKIAGINGPTPLWKLIDQIISTHLEPSLEGLVVLTNYPIETICLAKRNSSASHIAERFEVYLNGLEIGHGFMDATDADDVLARMTENGGRFVDHGFVDLLRSGDLPACGGFGLGVERLLAASDGARVDVRQYLHAYQHS